MDGLALIGDNVLLMKNNNALDLMKVVKNTCKRDRAKLLRAWDTNKEGAEVLVRQQHKRAKGAREEEEAIRTKGCMFHLLHILFSDSFFTSFLETRRQLRCNALDQSSGFTLRQTSALSVEPGRKAGSKFARAEAGSETSGQNEHDLWEFGNSRTDVYYLDHWCGHRQSGREFCAANVYSEDEDDSAKEGDGHQPKTGNRKRRKGFQPDMMAALIETVNELLENESSKTQEDTWMEQKLLFHEKQSSRNVAAIQELKQLREEYIQKGTDATEVGQALAKRTEKELILKEQIDLLEFEVLNGI
ncbi:hypothetical protein GQ600_24345 [Phytophthora cactorum]|nr:hypothetical protein GQ600_24345 [Phytophthora cactorum]